MFPFPPFLCLLTSSDFSRGQCRGLCWQHGRSKIRKMQTGGHLKVSRAPVPRKANADGQLLPHIWVANQVRALPRFSLQAGIPGRLLLKLRCGKGDRKPALKRTTLDVEKGCHSYRWCVLTDILTGDLEQTRRIRSTVRVPGPDEAGPPGAAGVRCLPASRVGFLCTAVSCRNSGSCP